MYCNQEPLSPDHESVAYTKKNHDVTTSLSGTFKWLNINFCPLNKY